MDLSCLRHDLYPWGLNCLHHDVHLWNLCDHNNGYIDHLISVLQLGNLCGLLNHLVHVSLSLRHDRDVNGLVHELQRWNLDPLGLLVDFLLDDVFLHFDCVDDVLNAHVHTLLRLFFRLGFNDLSSETQLNPVLGGSLEELCRFLHILRNQNVKGLLPQFAAGFRLGIRSSALPPTVPPSQAQEH